MLPLPSCPRITPARSRPLAARMADAARRTVVAASVVHAATRTIVALLFAAVALATPASAQEATLQVTQGPYYAGVPIDLQVVAEGFEEEPTPEVDVATPAGTRLDFVAARPQVSSMVQIINGRMTQSREVRHGFVYRLSVQEPGTYALGPFTVKQAGKQASTGAYSVKVAAVPEGTGQKLRVLLPTGPVFVGQRVPVTVEWWTEAGVADRLYNQGLHVPLFLDEEHFQFLDEKKEESRIAIAVDLPGGPVEFPAEVRQQAEGGRNWVVRSIRRTMVPVAAGRYEFARPQLNCEEAVSFRRDIFGQRMPAQTRRVRVSADAAVLEVAAVPVAGRPASFSGAIGQGFTMEVAADRTVLQTGDPVKLAITVRGDGALDSAALPPLAAAGLAPAQFRLPDGNVAGLADDGAKRFEVTVRVLDAAVREIPPLEFSWFNPEAGRFESTRSEPVALSVRAGTVVGAGDVVSAAPAAPAADAQEADAGRAGQAPAAGGVRPAYSLTGADLAVETDPAKLRPQASILGSAGLAGAAYLAGLAALAGAALVRRRRATDPERARVARELRALEERVARERSAAGVADALRRMAALAAWVSERPPALDQALAGLDEMAYAPGGSSAEVPAALRATATAAAKALAEASR